MLKDTLVVWCGEFGRTPTMDCAAAANPTGATTTPKRWRCGLPVAAREAGHTVGATDEIGAEAVECVHHIRDVHVTLLHLLGLDDNKLTYYHAGRHKQLSQFGGEVIDELIA